MRKALEDFVLQFSLNKQVFVKLQRQVLTVAGLDIFIGAENLKPAIEAELVFPPMLDSCEDAEKERQKSVVWSRRGNVYWNKKESNEARSFGALSKIYQTRQTAS